MWEYIVVGILVAAAVFCVVRRLVKGATGGGCGSCKCRDDPDATQDHHPDKTNCNLAPPSSRE